MEDENQDVTFTRLSGNAGLREMVHELARAHPHLSPKVTEPGDDTIHLAVRGSPAKVRAFEVATDEAMKNLMKGRGAHSTEASRR